MRYSIFGFNQEEVIKIKKEIINKNNKLSILKLDGNDLIILKWILDYYAFNSKKFIDNENSQDTIYMWINYQKLLNDLPILDISKQALGDRLNKLTELNLLKCKQYQGIKNGSMKWVSPTILLYNLLYKNTTENEDEQLYSTTSANNEQLYSTTSQYNNIINNKDLYNNTSHSSKDKCNCIINKSGEPQAVAKPKQIQLKSSHKKSLLENDLVFDDLMEKRKEVISRPRPRVQIENVATKSKKELKRESYLRKAIEITIQTLKLSEPEKISLIKDWFDTLYDKGFTSTELPKFKYALEEVQNAFTKYSWETFSKIIKDAITANHSTLRYVIQSQNSSRYNKQTLSDRIKFPGMRENESVDEYIGRTKEIEDERQKALKEIEEAENDDSKPWY